MENGPLNMLITIYIQCNSFTVLVGKYITLWKNILLNEVLTCDQKRYEKAGTNLWNVIKQQVKLRDPPTEPISDKLPYLFVHFTFTAKGISSSALTSLPT